MDRRLGDDDAVGAVVHPEAHLARVVGVAVAETRTLRSRVALLDEAQEEDVADRDAVDADLRNPIQQRRNSRCPRVVNSTLFMLEELSR